MALSVQNPLPHAAGRSRKSLSQRTDDLF